MAEIIKAVETYRLESSEQADDFIMEQGDVASFHLSKSVKDHKIKKDDEFYLVTLTKLYNN